MARGAGLAYAQALTATGRSAPASLESIPMPNEKWNAVALAATVVVVAVAGPWIAGQLRTLPARHALAARAEQKVVALEVGGMTCGGCASVIRASLAEVPGVVGAEVRYRERRAFVVCDRAVTDSALTQAVHRAGPGFLAAIASR